MTNRFLVSVAALALIAGTGFANAQGTKDRESGGASMQSAPASVGGAEQKSPIGGQNQRAERNAPESKSKSMSSENESKGRAKNKKAEGREERNANKRAESKERRAVEKNAENREGREHNTKTEARGGDEHLTTGLAGAAAKLSTEQRSRITTIIRDEHVAPANNIDFAVSVGTRVPRERVSLRPLPIQVVNIYPEWRGYEFFLVRDQIIVVDPRTLEIVAVLEA